jgi:hypothetical protein
MVFRAKRPQLSDHFDLAESKQFAEKLLANDFPKSD